MCHLHTLQQSVPAGQPTACTDLLSELCLFVHAMM